MPASVRSLSCPTCGAPLETDGTHPVIRCKFCQNVILIDAIPAGAKPKAAPQESRGVPEKIMALLREGDRSGAISQYRVIYDVSNTRAQYAIQQIMDGNLLDPEAGFPSPGVIPEAGTTLTPAAKAQLVKGAKVMGFMIPLLICLVLSGVIALVLFVPGGFLNPQLNAFGPAVLLSNDSGSMDVVTQFYNVDKEARQVGRVSGENGKILWKGEFLPGDQYVDHMLTDGTLVFYDSKAQLTALNAADGSPAWQVSMPDEVEIEKNSIVLMDGTLFAITRDRSLQAYDAGTGAFLWDRQLEGYGRQIRVIRDRLVIFDELQSSSNGSLVILDPADGSQVQVITPTCHAEGHLDDDLDFENGILVDDSTNSIFVVYGLFKGCIQKFDLSTGQLSWQYTQENDFNSLNRGFYPLVVDRQFYFTDDHDLYSLNMDDNSVHLIMQNPDYDFQPLALDGNMVIVRARRTRGTERFELWGVDLSSGTQIWQMVLEKSKPLDPPDEFGSIVDIDDYAFTFHDSADGFLLLEFKGEPNQLILQGVNPLDGSLKDEKVVPFKAISG
ncbi:MAG: PQQ-binding-like beta-propeller repeat protein, partial [Anaerolineales bacterium]